MTSPSSTEHLRQRVRALFEAGKADEVHTAEMHQVYGAAKRVKQLSVDVPAEASTHGHPKSQIGGGEHAASAWLHTPNPTFGGLSPECFLCGNDEQRAFFEGVLASLEDGAFS